ncbi:hypothetical protein HMPREF1399_01017 [Helicobacter pylori GAM118Bi]|nr:hypothetical protein HMPREF1399_01017 [Helicobacter pylori GAM118Bi]
MGFFKLFFLNSLFLNSLFLNSLFWGFNEKSFLAFLVLVSGRLVANSSDSF